MPSRRVRTLRTTAAETGVGPRLLRKILEDAGAIPEDDARPLLRRTFDADRHRDLLDEIPSWVGPEEMCAALGASRGQFAALAGDDILTPRTHAPAVKYRWRREVALAFIKRLTDVAKPLPDCPDDDWVGLQDGRTRSGLGMSTMIEAIFDGSFLLGLPKGAAGFEALRVRQSQLDG